MLSQELRTYLGRRLCRDVVGIIEEYVVGQARRVARAWKEIVRKVEWCDQGGEYLERNIRMVWYGRVLKEIYTCKKCQTVDYVYISKDDKMSGMIEYWDCEIVGKCGDGKLYEGAEIVRMIGDSFKVRFMDDYEIYKFLIFVAKNNGGYLEGVASRYSGRNFEQVCANILARDVVEQNSEVPIEGVYA
ncbi:hypothetical protein BNJ_00458 [Kaumoebavirus]|uniref:hypothetical protein n=1 Tax=Kaumoebavirus TaxID=1859492 RepID=UPI0009C2E5F0|nr:hypothetical protein BNJ_00458 [Kaumoebavirus]ARA72270.1 hypothetical protein BNJ_00458 [Kaumoebavirus]